MERVLNIIWYALSRETSRAGKVPIKRLTLVATVLILAGATLVAIFHNRLPVETWIVTASILVAFFLLVYTVQDTLLKHRLVVRQRLYQAWQHQHTLTGYLDHRVDASGHIAIYWQWRTPQVLQVSSQGDLQINAASRLRNIAQSLQQLTNTSQAWIVDIERLRENVIYAYTVPVNGFAHRLFQTQLTILTIAQNAIDPRNLPHITFENLREVTAENGIYFDSVTLTGFQAQHFTPETLTYAKAAFWDNFIEQPNHTWEVDARGNGTVVFFQVPLD